LVAKGRETSNAPAMNDIRKQAAFNPIRKPVIVSQTITTTSSKSNHIFIPPYKTMGSKN